MRNMPKHGNTKKDVLVSLESWPEKTKSYLEIFLNNVEEGMIDHKLADEETEQEDGTHKIREIYDEETGNLSERYQMVGMENPNCKLYKLSLTKTEAQDIVG